MIKLKVYAKLLNTFQHFFMISLNSVNGTQTSRCAQMFELRFQILICWQSVFLASSYLKKYQIIFSSFQRVRDDFFLFYEINENSENFVIN